MKTASSKTQAGRQARAEQILTAAESLLLRHGYQRITMEDVAQHARTGTGTIYLHWKTKEALFETVLLRELVGIWAYVQQLLTGDPTNALLHRFLGHVLRAVKERPLARALFTRDTDLLGKLAQQSVVFQAQPLASGAELMTVLRQLGLIRSDVALEAQSYAFSALWAGFSLVDPLLSSADHVSIDTQVAALAMLIQRAFEPEALPDEVALREQIVPALQAFLEQAQASFEEQIQIRMASP